MTVTVTPPSLTTPWDRAVLALRLLQIDPIGLGGIWVKARSGPVRDQYMAGLMTLPQPIHRLHPNMTDEQLFGGMDLSATLDSGQIVRTHGLVQRTGTWVLTMAERCPAGLAGRLASVLDGTPPAPLIALDEGEPGETLPPALTHRLAFAVELDGLRLAQAVWPKAPDLGKGPVDTPDMCMDALVSVAAQLGIDCPRAVLFALRTARAHAIFGGRDCVAQDDLSVAAALVLAPRATQLPQDTEDDPSPPPPPPPDAPDSDPPQTDGERDSPLPLPEDILLEAVKTALPPDILARLATQKARTQRGGINGSGDSRKGNRRGRPLPPRAGVLNGANTLDLVATLRAAAPWQTIRRRLAGQAPNRLHIQTRDIRIKRFEERSDRLLIFTVDASGSAALARLAEAKGAIELLLAQAYARRDHVALVAFRGAGADVLLPPTRSLVQTKRRLAALAGGGGTPLAHGMQAGLDLAVQAKDRGLTPTLALLTDGRANIALDGTANRARAAQDSTKMAQRACAQQVQGLVIDTSKRPERSLQRLAETFHAPYIPLPRADSHRLSQAVAASLDA